MARGPSSPPRGSGRPWRRPLNYSRQPSPRPRRPPPGTRSAIRVWQTHSWWSCWRITSEGRIFAESGAEEETAVDVDTGIEQRIPSGSARGVAFERYAVTLLRAIYPHYAWYHQGRDKGRERGVDFVGSRLGDARGEPASIGVQVKFHAATNAPTE